jgi:thiamine biosynthesis protein ThiI
MLDTITIHYSEIALKRGKRSFFEHMLMQNIKKSLNGLPYNDIRRNLGRILVQIDNENIEIYRNVISKVFGVKWFAFAKSVKPRDFDLLIDTVIDELHKLQPFNTFKIDTTRADKSFPYTSMEVNKKLGSAISNKFKNKVSMENPEIIVYIEILNDQFLIYTRKYEGPGGLPVGTSGKVLHLFSGGIDSPVAAWLLMKRGALVDYIHFYAVHDANEARQSKVGELIKFLTYFSYKSRAFYVPFHIFHLVAASQLDPKLETVIFRRFMVRIAERLAKMYGYQAISTGESLAQVASQTMQNMISIAHGIQFQILRPLLTYDKEEIINLAKRIGTYEISLKECKDACSLISSHPKTNVTPEEILDAEQRININKLIEKTLNETTIIEYKLSQGRIEERQIVYQEQHYSS